MIDVDVLLERVRARRDREGDPMVLPRAEQAAALAALIRPNNVNGPGDSFR